MHGQGDHDRLIEKILNHPNNRNGARHDLRKLRKYLECFGLRDLEEKLAELPESPQAS